MISFNIQTRTRHIFTIYWNNQQYTIIDIVKVISFGTFSKYKHVQIYFQQPKGNEYWRISAIDGQPPYFVDTVEWPYDFPRRIDIYWQLGKYSKIQVQILA